MPGACCFGPDCVIMFEEECYAAGGDWDGYFDCFPDPCPEDPVIGPPCPPGGLDRFPETHAAFVFDAPGIGPRAIIASGPTSVLRRYRDFVPPDNHCVIQTEIVELELTGVFDPDCRNNPRTNNNVTVTLSPQGPTLGSINSSDDGMGNPDFPDTSSFDVFVEIDIDGVGVFQHTVAGLGNLLQDGDLGGDPPCIHPSDPYRPPALTHAHIPCPEQLPEGCCELPPEIGGRCVMTNQVICELLGGNYLGDGVECPPEEPCSECGPGPHWIDTCVGGRDVVPANSALIGIDYLEPLNCIEDESMIMRPCPAPDDMLVIDRTDPLERSTNFPWVGAVDGHNDVIDTEIISMCLQSGGFTLRAGQGQGQGAAISPSLGTIVEVPGDPRLGWSFFHVYFEFDLGGGSYVYNHEPMIIEGRIDCVPPRAGYIHFEDCLPLYDSPQGGQLVAFLTRAQHIVYPPPPEIVGVCCLGTDCTFMTMEDCFFDQGLFQPQLEDCTPETCPVVPVGVESDPQGRITTALYAVVPNPFTQSTTMKYYLAETGPVTINVYDASGRLVRRLLSGERDAGHGWVDWDGRNDNGVRVSAGIYFARLVTAGATRSQRMITLE
jgi:hypothetical protein